MDTSTSLAGPERPAPCRARWIWWSGLGLFCLAGATGAFFRFKQTYGGLGLFSLGNVRHAHSHLMYMGWATPVLMGLIWRLLPQPVARTYDRAFRATVGTTFAAALLCYPLFLLYGYTPVQLGPVRMPVAAAASGLNILCWYAFVGLYIAGTRGRSRTGSIQFWDVSLAFLVLSTIGAWGVGVLHALDVHDPIWTTASIHFYLDLFSEGWFVLGLLGVMVAVLGPSPGRSLARPLLLVACGLPASFLMVLPSAHLSVPIELAGRLGGGLVGGGLLLIVARLGHRVRDTDTPWLWWIPLLALGGKAIGQLAGALVPKLWPSDVPGLRMLYLHLMLLGFVSMGLVAGARAVWNGVSDRGVATFYGAVGLVLGSLVLLVVPGGGGTRHVAAWASLGPLLAAALVLIEGRLQHEEPLAQTEP